VMRVGSMTAERGLCALRYPSSGLLELDHPSLKPEKDPELGGLEL
jgi:hypothetical protein